MQHSHPPTFETINGHTWQNKIAVLPFQLILDTIEWVIARETDPHQQTIPMDP